MARPGVLRCLAAAVLFGASAPAASRLAGEVPAATLAGLLYAGAALAVAPIAMRGRAPLRALGAGGRRLAVAVAFGGALGPLLFMAALARIPAAEASLLLNLELVATTLIAAVVFREYLGARLLASVGLIVAAGVMLVWSAGAGVSFGGLLVVAACLCWGVDNATTARIDRISPEQITFAKGAFAGTANIVLGLAIAGTTGLDARSVLAALAIGALGYGLSITLWVKGARDLGAARGQAIFAAAPFVGALVAWGVLGESLSGVQLLAALVAAAGVALSIDTAHTHWHRHEPLEHEHEHAHDDGHHLHEHVPPIVGRHTHRHRHEAMEHRHPHVPDLHHQHDHPHGRRR